METRVDIWILLIFYLALTVTEQSPTGCSKPSWKEGDTAKMLSSPQLSFWEGWECLFPTGSLGIWGSPNSCKWYRVLHKAWTVLEEIVVQYQSFQESLCIWVFCWSSSQFLSTKSGFTCHGDYTDKKQNTKPSSISSITGWDHSNLQTKNTSYNI